MQTSFRASVESLTTILGEFDVAKNAPIVTVDAGCLLASVQQLWLAVKEQRGVFEFLEKELQRRRTEMDVRFKQMQSELEGFVDNESKKRRAEDEKLRQELMVSRDDLKKAEEKLRNEQRELHEAQQRIAERAAATTKLAVADVHQKVQDLQSEVTLLRDAMRVSKADNDAASAASEKHRSESSNLLTATIKLFGLNPNQVIAASSNGTEVETVLKTPPFALLQQRLKQLEDRTAETSSKKEQESRAPKQASVTVDDNAQKKLLDELRGEMAKIDQKFRSLADRLDAHGPRFDATDSQLASLVVKVDSISALAQRDGASKEELAALAQKANSLRLSVESNTNEVQELRRYQQSTSDTVQKCEMQSQTCKSDIELLRKQVNRLEDQESRQATSSAAAPQPSGAPPPTAASPDLARIEKHLYYLDEGLGKLRATKAERSELTSGLSELAKNTEKALSDFFELHLSATRTHQTESTAGRFRCISCNRDAGTLYESVQERMGSTSFPPSTMIVQDAAVQKSTKPVVGSRQPIPGFKEYGSHATASRKKLMQYYAWLQNKADTTVTRPSVRKDSPPKTISPRHPWSGAQSGEGTPGERQCGDHGGAPDPNSIGSDGKYYVGVVPQPDQQHARRASSAPARGRHVEPAS